MNSPKHDSCPVSPNASTEPWTRVVICEHTPRSCLVVSGLRLGKQSLLNARLRHTLNDYCSFLAKQGCTLCKIYNVHRQKAKESKRVSFRFRPGLGSVCSSCLLTLLFLNFIIHAHELHKIWTSSGRTHTAAHILCSLVLYLDNWFC